MVTLLIDGRGEQRAGARSEGDSLWLSAADLAETAGWTLEPEGLCQGEVCVPIPPGQLAQWIHGGDVRSTEVNVAALWRHLGRPVLHDGKRETWVFGAGAEDRGASLRNLAAPDFALPDLNGTLHRLSDYRGRRVFLVTWASW
jgi:hypothetical protein